ncbi:hypothetical protein [Halococcus salifodinae]|uniref:Uncharacterized protein n=1 Tax=Halococcus salifodinae DSM 8989 TaxID=1227456 RepID=M0MSX1_9EURY|nr:hypothetical protein [Halococcus salifodinae]EMA48842.1 hypothetical protein C450_18884 [Halococcus salifodinae DSM 8989]
MNSAKLQAISKYGAILSVVGTAIAISAFVVLGPNSLNSFIALILGFLAPLCGFFFIGMIFYDDPTYHVWGEEFMRGVAWHFGSLMGWALIITASNTLPATAFTVLGLPALTALGIVLVMVGIRQATGLDLKVQTESGQLLQLIMGTIAFGFLALYVVLTGIGGWWVFAAYLVSIPVGLAGRRRLKQRYPEAL